MINFLDNKLTKKVTIGDYQFDIAINRKMSAEAFSKFPKYWECISKTETFEKAKESIKNKKLENKSQSEMIEELASEIEEDIDFSNYVEYINLESDLQEAGFEIVNYLLPKMLKYAENGEVKTDKEYEDFANEILQFCYDNNILFSYYDSENVAHKGVSPAFMEFITQGFTIGGKKMKSAVKVTIE